MAQKNNANAWILSHSKIIEAIKRQLIEYNYAGSYGGSIDLMRVNNIIDGALIEITKLQNQVTDLNQKNISLKEIIKTLRKDG